MNPEAVRTVTDIIQWANLAGSILLLSLSVAMGYFWKQTRPYLVLPITFAVHSIVFYAFALAHAIVSPYGNLWSAALRLHGYGMMLAALGAVARALMDKDDE